MLEANESIHIQLSQISSQDAFDFNQFESHSMWANDKDWIVKPSGSCYATEVRLDSQEIESENQADIAFKYFQTEIDSFIEHIIDSKDDENAR